MVESIRTNSSSSVGLSEDARSNININGVVYEVEKGSLFKNIEHNSTMYISKYSHLRSIQTGDTIKMSGVCTSNSGTVRNVKRSQEIRNGAGDAYGVVVRNVDDGMIDDITVGNIVAKNYA